MEYDNTNKFALWKNQNRSNDKHPHFRGTFTDHRGNEYWMSMWWNKDAQGKRPTFSGSIEAKEGSAAPPPRQVPTRVAQTFQDAEVVDNIKEDDLPF